MPERREFVGNPELGAGEVIQRGRTPAAAAGLRDGAGLADDAATDQYPLQIRRVDLMPQCCAIDVTKC